MIVKNSIAFVIAVLGIAPAFAEAADLGPYRPARPEPQYAPPPPPVPEDPFRYNWSGLYYGLSAGYGWEDHGRASTSAEGALGSATLGFNYQVPSGLLIGLEGDLGLTDISAYDMSFGPLWGTLRARAGLAFGRTLVYGTGGLAFMDVDHAGHEELESGLVLGAGVEQALSSSMSLKFEYLHMDFDSSNNGLHSFENDVDLVRAGLNFRF